jgi:hypothetical protein
MAADRAEPADRGFYVYGIVGTERPELTGVTGVDGRSAVFMLDEDGLGAIVSEVPLAEFGEDALRRNLEELSWVAEKVRAHEDVLERAAREALDERRPGESWEAIELELVDDRPGMAEDAAHLVATGPGGRARVILARTEGGDWYAERVE